MRCFRCCIASLFLLPGFGIAQSNITDSDSHSEGPIIIERHLSDGAPVTITIQSADEADGVLNITMAVSGMETAIPEECLTDLRECNVPDGVQVADFAGDIFLLLAGGEGDSSWQAKLTLRDRRVAERELRKVAGNPEITVYDRPLDVHEGRISSEELQNESRSKGTTTGSVRP